MTGKSRLLRKRNYFGFVFIAPWLIGFLLFFIAPLINSFIFSISKLDFTQASGTKGYTATVAGIANYVTALRKDEFFIKYLYEAAGDFFIDVPVILVFSFFVAVLLKQKFKGNFIVKAIFFLPVILGSGVFLQMQSSTAGYTSATIEAAKNEGVAAIQVLQSVNVVSILKDFGLPPGVVGYLTGPVDRIYSIISLSGVQIFIFLAGLNSISPSIYEASYIEGASGWETFWKITLPMVSPVIIVSTVYSIVDSFTASTNGPMTYIRTVAFSNFDYALSSAMSWIYFIIMGAVIGICMFFISKKVYYQV